MIRSHRCESTSISPSVTAPASTRIFDPDYTSLCNFPQSAVKVVANNRTRMVRFNTALNVEFTIQHRSSQPCSVAVEKIINRISRLRQDVDAAYSDMDDLDGYELALQTEVDILRDNDVYGVFHAKQLHSALESKSKHIDQEMQDMRIEMLCLKSKCRQLQRNMDRLVLQHDLPSSQRGGRFCWAKIAETFLTRTFACPLPHKGDHARLAAAKCA